MWYRYTDIINDQNFNLHVLDNKTTNRETRISQNLIFDKSSIREIYENNMFCKVLYLRGISHGNVMQQNVFLIDHQDLQVILQIVGERSLLISVL